jgi:hypothetical protein
MGSYRRNYMKLKRFFWIGIAVAGAAAVIACGGDSGPGATPEQELGAELARASRWTVLLEHGIGDNVGDAQGAWSMGNFLASSGSNNLFPPLDDLDNLFGDGAEVSMQVVERLSQFSDVLVLPNNEANRDLFEDYQWALTEALIVLSGASWTEASHYREVMLALRDAREALEEAARPRGDIDRLPLLAAIHDASVMYFQTAPSLVFNPDERGRSSGLGWDLDKFYAFRAPMETMQFMREELNSAAVVAFNNDTLRPVDRESVRLATEALQLRSDIFARDRQENERWMRLLWGIAGDGGGDFVVAITDQQLRPSIPRINHAAAATASATAVTGIVTAVLSPNLQGGPTPAPGAGTVTWTFVNPANNQPYPDANIASATLAPMGWTLAAASTVNAVHGGNWIAQMVVSHNQSTANSAVTARVRATVGTGANAVHEYIDLRARPAIYIPSPTLAAHPGSGTNPTAVSVTGVTAWPFTAAQLGGSGGITWTVVVYPDATTAGLDDLDGALRSVTLSQRTAAPTISVANLNELRLATGNVVVIYANHATTGAGQIAAPGRSANIVIP